MSRTEQARAFTALARPWAHGWELHVDGHGVTRVPVPAEAAQQVRDHVSTVTGTEVADDAPLGLRHELGGLEERLADIRTRTERAATVQIRAAAATREPVAGLRAGGIGVDEIAALLEVSRRRLSQLLAG
ncbi:MAG TPA: hypothetical protein VHV82_07760 [Sporichthyaceae bacterium]|nr:hypothetical protein [Sporichthyaceae bacterium]